MAGREAMRNRERLEHKFFVEYFRSQHKDIYAEAYDFYQTVKEKNPLVRDLTKTIEFVGKTKPYEAIPRYYYRRKVQTTTVKKQTELRMTLNIPLTRITTAPLTVQAPPQTLTTTSPPAVPSPSALPLTVQAPPQVLTMTSPPSVPSPSAQPLPVPLPVPSPPPVELLTLPDETFHHLLCEIQQDPDLYSIFNNFDTASPNDDDDDGMNPLVWHDISTQGNISPIEMGLP